MCKLKSWFDRNKLTLNFVSKTKIMFVGNCKRDQVHVQVEGVDTERVHENKFLGVCYGPQPLCL